MRRQFLRGSQLTYLGGSDAFVVAIVPFGDLVGDGDAGVGAGGAGCRCLLGLPGKGVVAADVEELEGALGAGAG